MHWTIDVPMPLPEPYKKLQITRPDEIRSTRKFAFYSISKLGGAGDRFGDYLCVNRVNLLCISGCKRFTNTKFTTPTVNPIILGERGACSRVLATSGPDILFLNHENSILRQSSNPVCGFFLMDQVRLCFFAHRELAWLFHEPDTVLDDCLRILLSSFRKWMSALATGRVHATFTSMLWDSRYVSPKFQILYNLEMCRFWFLKNHYSGSSAVFSHWSVNGTGIKK